MEVWRRTAGCLGGKEDPIAGGRWSSFVAKILTFDGGPAGGNALASVTYQQSRLGSGRATVKTTDLMAFVKNHRDRKSVI